MPEGAPLKDKTAIGVADFLFTVFCHHGWPDVIISDQGREFVNKLSRYFSKVSCAINVHNTVSAVCLS